MRKLFTTRTPRTQRSKLSGWILRVLRVLCGGEVLRRWRPAGDAAARPEIRRRAPRGSREPGGGRVECGAHRRRRGRTRAPAVPVVPVVIVHGGGKEIDAALKRAGIEKRQVDGLRITDDATLDVVVAVLAGAINTRLVAALNAAGVRAVRLTGADANCGLSDAAAPHQAVDGRVVDLERVGVPSADADMRLLQTLSRDGFVPVVACIGIGREGQLFNVNADTLAGHLAARLGARRLVIAGTTARRSRR